MYELANHNGALAGKLCGSGAGGFLFSVPPDQQGAFINAMPKDTAVTVNIAFSGTTVGSLVNDQLTP